MRVKDPAFVEPIKAGVIREKNRDLGFKVMNDVEPFRLRVSYDEETLTMTFELVQRLGMVEKVVT